MQRIKNPEFQYSSFEHFDPFSFRLSQNIFIPSQYFPPSSHHNRHCDQFIGSWFTESQVAFLQETVLNSIRSSAALEFIFLMQRASLKWSLFRTLMSPVMGQISSLFMWMPNRTIFHVLRALLLTWFVIMKVTGSLIGMTVHVLCLLWKFRFTLQFTASKGRNCFHDYCWFWQYSLVLELKTNASFVWFVINWCSFPFPVFSKLQMSFPRWGDSCTQCWWGGLTKKKREDSVSLCWNLRLWMTRATRIHTGRRKDSKGAAMIEKRGTCLSLMAYSSKKPLDRSSINFLNRLFLTFMGMKLW